MAYKLPISKVEDVEELHTKDIIKYIQDVHVYFEEINTINGIIHYRGYYGGYIIDGLAYTLKHCHKYSQHEMIKNIKWFKLDMKIEICGTLIYRALIENEKIV